MRSALWPHHLFPNILAEGAARFPHAVLTGLCAIVTLSGADKRGRAGLVIGTRLKGEPND